METTIVYVQGDEGCRFLRKKRGALGIRGIDRGCKEIIGIPVKDCTCVIVLDSHMPTPTQHNS